MNSTVYKTIHTVVPVIVILAVGRAETGDQRADGQVTTGRLHPAQPGIALSAEAGSLWPAGIFKRASAPA